MFLYFVFTILFSLLFLITNYVLSSFLSPYLSIYCLTCFSFVHHLLSMSFHYFFGLKTKQLKC